MKEEEELDLERPSDAHLREMYKAHNEFLADGLGTPQEQCQARLSILEIEHKLGIGQDA